VGEGGAERSSATGEGYGPHVMRLPLIRPRFREGTFSHKGRREEDALLSMTFYFFSR
jgi:hypothetical protein